MSFPRYPKYKASGVEWLGEVPEHWEVCTLKRIVSMQSGESITAESIEETGDYPVFGGNGLRGYTTGFTHDGKFVLIGRQGALCGNINYAFGKFWASEHAVVATPVKQVDTVWLGELLRAMNLNQYSVAAAQPGLSVDLVGRLGIVVPPRTEQTHIAAFLDRETAKIDGLVAEQRRLMELLKEKRQAVISHAVTKGLNPHAPMKHSGIEWIGEAPEHWEVRRIKNLSSMISKGTTPTTVGADFTLEGIRFLKAENITETGVAEQPEFYISDDTHVLLSRSSLEDSDVLVVIAGATTGKSAVLSKEFLPANTNQAVSFIRPKDKSFSYYINLWLGTTSVRNLILLDSVQSAQPNLSMEDLGNIPLLVPPPKELDETMAFLATELAKIDTLTAEAQRAIDLLQERRTALISAAVTGQIDITHLDPPYCIGGKGCPAQSRG